MFLPWLPTSWLASLHGIVMNHLTVEQEIPVVEVVYGTAGILEEWSQLIELVVIRRVVGLDYQLVGLLVYMYFVVGSVEGECGRGVIGFPVHRIDAGCSPFGYKWPSGIQVLHTVEADDYTAVCLSLSSQDMRVLQVLCGESVTLHVAGYEA